LTAASFHRTPPVTTNLHHRPTSGNGRAWPLSEKAAASRERVGDLKGRPRRIAIVAFARKLLVALWRYLETGLVPAGAVFKTR
jgi:hypothetical protein